MTKEAIHTGTMHIGIPKVDRDFLYVITTDIGFLRKVAGYIYAISKPMIFMTLGMTSVLLFIFMALSV